MCNEYRGLTKNAYISSFLDDIFSDLIFGGIIYAVYWIINKFDIPGPVRSLAFWLAIIIFSGIILVNLLDTLIGIKNYKYRITEEAVEVKSGIFGREHVIVPIRKIVQINVDKGVINTIFHIAKINIVTAGGDIDIDYLEDTKAEYIAEHLTKKINKFVEEGKNRE